MKWSLESKFSKVENSIRIFNALLKSSTWNQNHLKSLYLKSKQISTQYEYFRCFLLEAQIQMKIKMERIFEGKIATCKPSILKFLMHVHIISEHTERGPNVSIRLLLWYFCFSHSPLSCTMSIKCVFAWRCLNVIYRTLGPRHGMS